MRAAVAMGRAIKKLRGDRTQTAVARRAGVDRSSWSLYEKGKRFPQRNRGKVAKGLEVTEERLEQEVLRVQLEDLELGTERARGTLPPLYPGVTAEMPQELRAACHQLSAAIEEVVALILRHAEREDG